MSGRLIVTSLAIAALRIAPAAQTAPLFEFHSNAWLNLHHFARLSARPGGPASTDLSEADATAWAAGVEFYKRYASRDLLFDATLRDIKTALRRAEGHANLEGIGLDADLSATLERLMPIYQKRWWTEHDRANREWIASVQPLLARHGAALSSAIARAYETTWPGTPVPVDLCVTAGVNGAYTTGPTHVTISSSDPSYRGLHALEMLFHEASHGVDALLEQVGRAADEQQVKVPPQLWHAVLFYTAGELTTRELKAHGLEYQEYASPGLYTNLCGAGCRDRIVQHWQPFLDGRRPREQSLSALVASFK